MVRIVFHDTLFVKQDKLEKKDRTKKSRRDKRSKGAKKKSSVVDDGGEWGDSAPEDSAETQERIHQLEEFIQVLRSNHKVDTTRNFGQLQQLLATQEQLSPELACFSFSTHIENYPKECGR